MGLQHQHGCRANAIVETSPVLSYYDNGKQVAYIQRNGNILQLVLLKWQAGQGTAGAPATPTLSASAAAYRACVSGCYYAITLNGTSQYRQRPHLLVAVRRLHQ